ncbi:hypothetical protein [Gordonia polyisoprenivorans]|nr:hypothetical protein [Gordonia polyisoprenivorans]
MNKTNPTAEVEQILEEGAKIGQQLDIQPGEDPTEELYDDNGLPR